VSARFIGGKVLGSLATLLFVVCFNFFLFRVVETDPVASLYRGHNLTQTQRAKLTEEFGLDKSTGAQFVSPVHDRRGRIVGASKIARDIGPRRALEERQRLLLGEL